ncbi:hypothetical protein GCM10009717_21610 [Agromyces allii]|uniref:XRE family transcriptional regulator n=1 Tax=Agromyces allii TaxID=393607 RepID=A0ABN2QMY4_9MICO
MQNPEAESLRQAVLRLRAEMHNRSLTYQRVSDLSGIGDSAIKAMVYGTAWPDTHTLGRIEHGLGVALWPSSDRRREHDYEYDQAEYVAVGEHEEVFWESPHFWRPRQTSANWPEEPCKTPEAEKIRLFVLRVRDYVDQIGLEQVSIALGFTPDLLLGFFSGAEWPSSVHIARIERVFEKDRLWSPPYLGATSGPKWYGSPSTSERTAETDRMHRLI